MRASFVLAPAFIVVVASCATTGALRDFTSDGCSLFLDGVPSERDRWLHCCLAHDKGYWRGGGYTERKQIDAEFRACVAEAQDPVLARLMHDGVRVGGSPYWPTTYRWGYGWGYGRGYEALTEAEQERADRLLAEYERGAAPPVAP